MNFTIWESAECKFSGKSAILAILFNSNQKSRMIYLAAGKWSVFEEVCGYL